MRLTIAHSPDSDDAYMMAPLALGWLDCGDFDFEFIHKDIETLNQEAVNACYDVTAVSFGAYPDLIDKYDLLTSGSSVQDGAGPLLVSNMPSNKLNLDNIIVAVPGLRTSAYKVLCKYMPNVKIEYVPFDRILSSLLSGRHQAGLLIHEGQLLYSQLGLNLVQDLGTWWKINTGLPLPMGANAIRKSLDQDIKLKFAALMCKSVKMAIMRHNESLKYAMSFSKGLDVKIVEHYISLWINNFTVHIGPVGQLAVSKMLSVDVSWIEV